MSTTDKDHVVEGDLNPDGNPASLVKLDNVDTQGFVEFRVWSQTFYAVQRHRIAMSNRLASGQIPPDIIEEILTNTIATEKLVGSAMRKSFKRVAPRIYDWMKETPGVGEHLLARLLGAVGHPCIATPHHWEYEEGKDRVLVADEPFVRNVAKLWAYCGMGDPTRRRRTGMSEEDAFRLGNPRAKMLCRLLAESAMKQTGTKVSSDVPIVFSDNLPNNDASLEPFPDDSVDTSIPMSNPDHQEPFLHDSIQTAIPIDSSKHGEPFPDAAAVETTTTHNSQHQETLPPDPLTGTTSQIASGQEGTSARIRVRSPYRDIYEAARFKYSEREDWTAGHQHNAALRYVAKAILRDLWLVGREDLQA